MSERWGDNNTRRTFTNTVAQTDIINNYVDTATLYASQLLHAPAITYTLSNASNSSCPADAYLPGRSFYRNMLKTTGNTTDTLVATATFITAVETILGQAWNTYEYYIVTRIMKNNDSVTRNYIMNFTDTDTITATGASSVSTNGITAGSTNTQRLLIMRMSTTKVMFYVL